MSKPTTLTLRTTKHHVEIVGLSLSEAQEKFGGKASEEWGTVRIGETDRRDQERAS